MRGHSRASRAVRQRLQSLDHGLEAALETDAEGLHRARVATRRLREALPLLVPGGGAEPITDLRHVVRDATRALGGVRELDVALTLVDTLVAERPDLASSFDLVRTAMAGERHTRLDRMRQRLDVSRLQRASRALAERLDEFVDARQSGELLAERLRERIEGLRRAVVAAGHLYAPERLHGVRLAAKKLRYALELAGELRAASTKRIVSELRRTQELLGLLHDLETVAQLARRTLVHSRLDERSDPTLSLLDARIRAQHAEYLANRERLMALLDRALAVQERVRRRAASAAANDIEATSRRQGPPRQRARSVRASS
jgi:CHAD domain-containing protein